jgi:hypothetical protein
MFGFDEAEAEQGAASVHTVPSHNPVHAGVEISVLIYTEYTVCAET